MPRNKMDHLVQATMQNPIILHTIFRHLPIKGLKTARSICKKWHSVATALLGKRTAVSINQLFTGIPKQRSGSGRVTYEKPIHPRLFKNIAAVCHAAPDYGTRLIEWNNGQVISRNLVNTLQRQAGRVQEIHLNVDHYFAPVLAKILTNIRFLALRRIAIREDYHENLGGSFHGRIITTEFSPIPTLEVLDFFAGEANVERGPGVQETRTKLGQEYHAIYQGLVNNSPNLKELRIVGQNFYPDLSSCTKLRVLELRGVPYKLRFGLEKRLRRQRDFNCAEVMRMLDSVKTSLEILNLGCYFKIHRERKASKFPIVALPFTTLCFPKLTTLNLDDTLIYDKVFDSLTASRYPALQNLTITLRKNYGFFSDDLVKLWKNRSIFQNMKSLCLHHLSKRSLGRFFGPEFKAMFPNLIQFTTRLAPTWVAPAVPASDGVDLLVKALFKGFLEGISKAFVNLDHLTVQIPFATSLFKLMKMICSPSLKSDVKTLKLIDDADLVLDAGCEYKDFEQVFSHYRSITFEGFRFTEKTVRNMENCAHSHDAEIYFINLCIQL